MAANLITQTDAHGKALSRAPASARNGEEMLRAERESEQETITRDVPQRLAQMQLQRQHQNPPGLLSACLSVFCCLAGPGSLGPAKGAQRTLLPPQLSSMRGRKCLVLDLDETLVHSAFTPVPNPDYVLPVEIEGVVHRVYVLKRPGADEFLAKLGKVYEVVIFTASLAKYASPLLDLLDMENVIQHRLYRDSCTIHHGNYVKDLSHLGRDLKDTIIVDNSPASYLFHPENAIGVSTFIDDMSDRELLYALPFLEKLADAEDVTETLHTYPQFIQDQIAQNMLE